MAGFTVTSVTADQVPDASDNLIDVYDVTFTLDSRPGSFTVQVPTSGDPVAAADAAIQAVVSQVGGIYARARHPIYGGAILLAAGWSLLFATPLGGALTLVLLAFFELKARREEHWLVERYPEYEAYRARTRKRFLPYVL